MLTYSTHPQELEEIQKTINSGRFFSITFIKADCEIRHASGKKINYQSDSPDSEKRGKYNRLEKNLLLVWDVNKRYTDKEGNEVKGAFIQAKLEKLLFFKCDTFTMNFVEENAEAIEACGITPEQLDQAMLKTNMSSMIEEEMDGMLNEASYTISSLGQLFTSIGYDKTIIPIIQKVLAKEFKRGGDEAVVQSVKELGGFVLEPVSKGRYVVN